MAGLASVTMSLRVSGLGPGVHTLSKSFSGVVPTYCTHQYRVLAVADTEETLDLGGLDTIEGILIYADDLDLDVDCDFDAAFNADIHIAAGQSAYFKPAGVVKVKNGDAAETPGYEYIVFGTLA